MTTTRAEIPASRPAGRRRPARISVEKYEAMMASGAFTKRDRLELIEGSLVEKMTQNPPHSVIVGVCDDVIRAALPRGWHVRQEKPFRIPSRDSMPEPDVSVTRGGRTDWLRRHPAPEDVALVVEVADPSVEGDCDMALTYGGGGIPVYWIVNVRDRQLEVYSVPSGPAEPIGYRHCEVLSPGDSVSLAIEGHEVARIPVADFLPHADGPSD